MDPYIQRLENKALKHFVIDGAGRVPIDHADQIKGADYYLGSWLVAKKPVTIYSSPNGNVIGTRSPGQNVGRIYSYVNRDGDLYWQLEGESGNGTGGFVKHSPGAFDSSIAFDTSGEKELAEAMEIKPELPVLDDLMTGVSDTLSGVGKALSGFGNNLTAIIIVLIVIGIALAVFKLSKA